MNYFERLIAYEKLKEVQWMNLRHPKIKKNYQELTKKIREGRTHRPNDNGGSNVQ